MVSAAVAVAVACLHQHHQDCEYTSVVTLRRLAEGEKTNGRWAMMAVLGIMGQDLLGVQPAWYLHGEKVKQLHTHCVLTWNVNFVPGMLAKVCSTAQSNAICRVSNVR